MGGQKGIASFYGAFSKQLPVSLISVKGNATPENLNAEFLPILSNSKTRYFNPFVFFTIKKIIADAVASTGAAGPADMGKVMGAIKPLIAGKADGSLVSSLVKSTLAGGN